MTVRASIAGIGAVLLLCACSDHESPSTPVEPASAPPETAAPVPAPAPVAASLAGIDLGQPLRAIGTEPFWGLDVTAAGMALTGPDRPKTEAPSPKLTAQAAQAVFAGRTADGRDLTLTLTPGPCSDGMSDRTYPLNAVVTMAKETLKGCAASTAALARSGESGEVR
ncbi:COG3650 family protein [Caulobacter sp. 17J80-11]|uniref:COG3650 family protein n=1 Tax=Caulobacter sp. 17J80-11 TaxID=2763502 RepID=UPI001653A44E|nr:hypothetical protein [Caulobacter sp. 17J80-11]MBC6980198.1 hypothetical protein [Caulobacter sp. 17J80-11]